VVETCIRSKIKRYIYSETDAPSNVVSNLDVESVDNVKKLLKKKGYSDSAVGEILKWYEHNPSDRKA
jgi:hypothetical protein